MPDAEANLIEALYRGACDPILLVAIHDPARALGLTPRLITDALDLPPAAASLVCGLMGGKDLKAYAARGRHLDEHGPLPLKTAFARTGARSQTELVRRALMALSNLGLAFDTDGPGSPPF